jgi:hypothetical protein
MTGHGIVYFMKDDAYVKNYEIGFCDRFFGFKNAFMDYQHEDERSSCES